MSNDPNRRYDLSWKDIQDPVRGSRDPKTHEVRLKCACKYCGHKALEISKSGLFRCWACGAFGITVEDAQKRQEQRNQNKSYQSYVSPAVQRPKQPGGTIGLPAQSEGASAVALTSSDASASGLILQDYVSLPEEDLYKIEDLYVGDVPNERQRAVREWLREQHISLETALKAHVGVGTFLVQCKNEGEKKEHVCVVFRNVIDGQCNNAKFRPVTSHRRTYMVNGERRSKLVFDKGFAQLSACQPCPPYNVEVLWSAPRTIYFTEGEKDVLTLMELGFASAISVANGAQTGFEASFHAFEGLLEAVEEVVIVGDQDMPGRAMVRAAVAYFAAKRVRVAKWDPRRLGKDISDVHKRCGADVARRLVEEAALLPPQGVEDFASADVLEQAFQCARGVFDHGFDVGMGPRTNEHLRLSATHAGLIVVTGTPGTGKTDFTTALLASLMHVLPCHVCFCSFETPNKARHVADVAQIWSGQLSLRDMATEAEARAFVRTASKHMTHLLFPDGGASPEAILQKAEVVLAKHADMRFLIVDPYLYVELEEGRNVTETSAIKQMLRTFQHWAYLHNVWVLIVAHPRKLQKTDGNMELEEVDMYTIAGSANWANMADLVLSLRRVLCKEPKMDYTRLSVLKVRDQLMCKPGDVFYVRNWCGRYAECASEEDAKRGRTEQTEFAAWELDDSEEDSEFEDEALEDELEAFLEGEEVLADEGALEGSDSLEDK